MTEMTPLDAAHAAMEAAPDNETARLRYYERLVATELFLLLTVEPDGDQISPEVFEVADNSFVLAFDLEQRLSAFTERPSPFAALSGRNLCQMLAQNGLGLALNPEVAPSQFMLPPSAVAWLAGTVDQRPEEIEARIERLFAPKGLPDSLLVALDARLASAAGLARSAYLVGVAYPSGGQGHMLGVIDAAPGSEPALARAVSEALTFSGLDAALLDVAFFASDDPMAAKLAKDGLRFDLPSLEAPTGRVQKAPGMDPEKPPVLK